MSDSNFKGAIRSASVTSKGYLKVTYVNHETHGELPTNFKHPGVTGDRLVHKDLLTAFAALKGHAASIGELKRGPVDEKYIRIRDCVLDPDLSSYEVTGFTYKGDDDTQSVTLHVRRKLSKGGHYEFSLPSVRLYNKTVGGYEFSGNLVDDLADCEIEIAAYMGGKFADNGQLSLSFVDEDGELEHEDSEL